jgi:predicted DNA-binding transcriptional regulator AlpA
MVSLSDATGTALEAFEQLRQVEEAANALQASEVPRFVGELERVKTALVLRATHREAQPEASPPSKPATVAEDRMLTAEEVGRKLGRSRWWVYDHAPELPRVLLPGGKFGFSERQLEKWIERRTETGLDPRQELLRRRIRQGGRR